MPSRGRCAAQGSRPWRCEAVSVATTNALRVEKHTGRATVRRRGSAPDPRGAFAPTRKTPKNVQVIGRCVRDNARRPPPSPSYDAPLFPREPLFPSPFASSPFLDEALLDMKDMSKSPPPRLASPPVRRRPLLISIGPPIPRPSRRRSAFRGSRRHPPTTTAEEEASSISRRRPHRRPLQPAPREEYEEPPLPARAAASASTPPRRPAPACSGSGSWSTLPSARRTLRGAVGRRRLVRLQPRGEHPDGVLRARVELLIGADLRAERRRPAGMASPVSFTAVTRSSPSGARPPNDREPCAKPRAVRPERAEVQPVAPVRARATRATLGGTREKRAR